jgi:hypothetical protein
MMLKSMCSYTSIGTVLKHSTEFSFTIVTTINSGLLHVIYVDGNIKYVWNFWGEILMKAKTHKG